MLSSWGVSTAEYVLYTLVSGIWNIFARLGLPVGRPDDPGDSGPPGRPGRRRRRWPGLARRHGRRARPSHAQRVVRVPCGARAAARARHGLPGAAVLSTGPSPTCPRSPSARSRASRGGTRPALIHAKAADTGQPTEMSPSGPGPARRGRRRSARRVHQLLQPVPLAQVNDLLDPARIFTNNKDLPGQML